MKAKQIHEGVNYHLERGIPLHESVYRLGSNEYFNMFVEARKLYNEGKLKNLHWFDEEILRDTQLGEWVNLRNIGRVPLDMIISEENHKKFLEDLSEYDFEYTGKTHPSVDETREVDEPNFCYDCKLISNTIGEIENDDENDVVCPRCGSEAYVEASDEEIAKYATKNEAKYQGKNVELSKPKRGGSKKFYVYVRDPKTKNVKKVAFGAKSGGGNLAVKLRDPKARKAFADRHNCEQKKDKTKAGYWACRLPRYAKSLGLSGGGTWW